MEGGGQPVLSFEQCFVLFSSFPLLLAFDVGGLGIVIIIPVFDFCIIIIFSIFSITGITIVVVDGAKMF